MTLKWSLSLVALCRDYQHSVWINDINCLPEINLQKISETYFFGDSLVKWMLVLGFLHAVFPLEVRPHTAEPVLPSHANAMNGKRTNLQTRFECLLFFQIELNIRTGYYTFWSVRYTVSKRFQFLSNHPQEDKIPVNLYMCIFALEVFIHTFLYIKL